MALPARFCTPTAAMVFEGCWSVRITLFRFGHCSHQCLTGRVESAVSMADECGLPDLSYLSFLSVDASTSVCRPLLELLTE